MPYSIDDWNSLLEDVNSVLQSPPSNTDCKPIAPIELVTPPHIWKLSDVTEVRDKLRQTCPSITFSAELRLWSQEFLDEIRDQMMQAWCVCKDDDEDLPSPETTITPVDNLRWTLIQAGVSSTQCCDNVVEQYNSIKCPGLHARETWYKGAWFANPYTYNNSLMDSINATYNAAYAALGAYVESWSKLMDMYRAIKIYQESLDDIVKFVNSYIAKYNATTDPNEKAYWASLICAYGRDAAAYQDVVDRRVASFTTEAATLSAKRQAANTTALENLQAVMGLWVRFPDDTNAIPDIFLPHFQEKEADWDKGFNPYTDEYLCSYARWQQNLRLAGKDHAPSWSIWYTNSKQPGNKMLSYSRVVSPNGIPLSGWGSAYAYLRKYTLTYYESAFRTRCESNSCPDAGMCEMPPWETRSWTTVHWEQNYKATGISGRVWAPLNVQDPAANGEDTFWAQTYRPIGGRQGVDNSQRQQQFLSQTSNWYDQHPQYDNRHTPYC